jgi:hypothetical protein
MSLLLKLAGGSVDAKVTWLQFDTAASGGATSYTLTCAAGTYSLTGNDATLTRAVKLPLAAGAYALTGNAATLTRAVNLTCASGSYSLTGNNALLSLNRLLPLAAGSYNYTGNDATLTYVPGASAVSYTLNCATGAYSYTGQSARGTLGFDMIVGYTPAEVWDEVLEGGYTAREIMRFNAAVLAGKVSGAGTGTEVFTGIDDSTTRITSTVDNDGNRSLVTRNGA